MSDAILAALITSVPPTVMSAFALFKANAVGKAVNEVHLAVNSRLTELLELTRKSALAEGEKAEKDKGKRQKFA